MFHSIIKILSWVKRKRQTYFVAILWESYSSTSSFDSLRRIYLTSTVLDDLSPHGITRKHLQITNNKEMPKGDKQQSKSIGNTGTLGDGAVAFKCAGLRTQDSGRSSLEHWPGRSVVFLGKTLYTRIASLYRDVTTNLLLGVTPRWTSIPSRGE